MAPAASKDMLTSCSADTSPAVTRATAAAGLESRGAAQPITQDAACAEQPGRKGGRPSAPGGGSEAALRDGRLVIARCLQAFENCLSIRPFVRSFIHSLTHSFIYSFIHSLPHLFTQ